MAFELKQLSENDVTKVCEDLENWEASFDKPNVVCVKPYIERLVSEYRRGVGSTWAVNSENGNYLVIKPGFVRPETIQTSFYFYFGGTFYELSVRGLDQHDVYLEGNYPNNSAFKAELKEALFVLGRNGEGSGGFFGLIDAVFSEEA